MRSAILTTLLCAGLLAGCQTTGANVCDGWERLSPSAETRSFLIAKDRPFAEQTAAHNRFGQSQNCWK